MTVFLGAEERNEAVPEPVEAAPEEGAAPADDSVTIDDIKPKRTRTRKRTTKTE